MHTCPDCGQACYCGGDIDDIDTGDIDAVDECTHDCQEPEDEGAEADGWIKAMGKFYEPAATTSG